MSQNTELFIITTVSSAVWYQGNHCVIKTTNDFNSVCRERSEVYSDQVVSGSFPALAV